MKAIDLNRPLELEQAVEVPDGMGGFAVAWERLGRLWAEVVPGAGRDSAAQEVVVATVRYKITVRGAPEGVASRPKPGQRFRDGGRIFSILAVTERDADARYLLCFAREETAP